MSADYLKEKIQCKVWEMLMQWKTIWAKSLFVVEKKQLKHMANWINK